MKATKKSKSKKARPVLPVIATALVLGGHLAPLLDYHQPNGRPEPSHEHPEIVYSASPLLAYNFPVTAVTTSAFPQPNFVNNSQQIQATFYGYVSNPSWITSTSSKGPTIAPFVFTNGKS